MLYITKLTHDSQAISRMGNERCGNRERKGGRKGGGRKGGGRKEGWKEERRNAGSEGVMDSPNGVFIVHECLLELALHLQDAGQVRVSRCKFWDDLG